MFNLGAFLHSVFGGVGNVMGQGAHNLEQNATHPTQILNNLYHGLAGQQPIKPAAPAQRHFNPAARGDWQAPINPITPSYQTHTPQLLGLPDYTAMPNFNYAHPNIPADSSFTRINPTGFPAHGVFVQPAQPQHFGRDYLNPGGPV